MGSLFRPDNPLLPNYKHVPIAYHGRTSSLVVSGTPVRRPWGQIKGPNDSAPSFRPSQRLDYETEVAAIIGTGNPLGEPIGIDEAERHVFGLCLLNDWSARDIQAWEYQPLGPFLAKNFATTISPWIVTLEALAPFRCAEFSRPEADPRPLPYLTPTPNGAAAGFDITIEVYLRSAEMRAQNLPALRLSRGSFSDMYWTVAQLVTHHTSNGCNLLPGDVIGSGTVSGPREDSRGCLLEITGGSRPLELPSGETASVSRRRRRNHLSRVLRTPRPRANRIRHLRRGDTACPPASAVRLKPDTACDPRSAVVASGFSRTTPLDIRQLVS